MLSNIIIQDTYDFCSNFYDSIFEVWLSDGLKLGIQCLGLKTNETVLEIGVGTGLSFKHYPPNVKVVAFDYSLGMLKEARKKILENNLSNITLLQMDAQNIAFASNSFNKIFAAYVLTVVPDLQKVMNEIFRVAKHGAKVVIINHLPKREGIVAKIEKWLNPVFSKIGLFTLNRDIIDELKNYKVANLEIIPTNCLALHHVISFNVVKN